MTFAPSWAVFLGSGALVVLAGIRLSRDGDTIAQRTGLGGLWIGSILVATATSLPELATGFFAVRQGAPSLAAGDLFGACMANMAMLAVADTVVRQPRLLTRVNVSQSLTAALAISLAATAALGILADRQLPWLPFGWSTLLLAAGYGAGMWVLRRRERAGDAEHPADEPDAGRGGGGLLKPLMGFTVAALTILVVANFLASSGQALADQFGIAEGFAGLVLLAVVTTLPEAVVSITGLRIRSYDMVVGNLLGSACITIALLFPLDLVHTSGALLQAVDPATLVGAQVAILMLALVLMELLNTSERRIWLIERNSLLLLAVYGGGLFLSFQAEH